MARVSDSAPGGERIGTPSQESFRILVIDDDKTAREIMRVMLAKEGYDVITAADGKAGLDLARKFNPSVITLDMIMPGLDGWDFLKELKADDELADIPVIMATMQDNPERGFALGASEYLTKPVDRERLKAVLKKLNLSGERNRVLLVEDDDTTRQVLRSVFSDCGWEVSEAENGIAAIERLTEPLPQLIMLDLLMPEMDGFEFLERVREIPEIRSVPIVVLTAAELTKEDHLRLNGGVEQVIQKTMVSREVLMSRIGELVSYHANGTAKIGGQP